jgi:hypothetical protein
MSWQIFKNNILQYANNPESLQDIDTVARIWATEYDAAIKRGGDVTNRIAIKQGDVESMTKLFKSALERGLTSKAPYDLVGEMGKGVIAYWQKATLNNFPVPIIPAPGTIANISITTAPITNSGKWTPAVSMPSVKEPSEEELYEKLDFEKAGIDKNDPKVKKIIKFDVAEFEEEVARVPPSSEFESDVFPPNYTEDTIFEDSELATGQLDLTTADTLNEALIEQEIIPNPPPAEDIVSGYKTLDELLKIAGKWARTLGKSPRVKYENLKSGYVKGIHGLCGMGVKSVVSAMLGIKGLGQIGGNANQFSFSTRLSSIPGPAGIPASFAETIGGKKYYNGKIKIEVPMVTVLNKKTKKEVKVPNYMGCYVGQSSQWRVGDILALDYYERPHGHIQIWTGFAWQSDYTQRSVNGLANANPNTFALWRLNDNGAAALAEYSSPKNSKKV